MLITNCVKVKLYGKNVKHFEELGYSIPTKIGAKGYKVACIGQEIEVKTEDLNKWAKNIVKVKCDYCGEESYKKYCVYAKGLSSNNKYACKKCVGEKMKDMYNKRVRDYIEHFEEKGFKCVNNQDDIVKNRWYKFKLFCVKNHEWNVTYEVFNLNKGKCPMCNGIISKWTYEMACDFLTAHGAKMLSEKSEFTSSKNSVINYKCKCGDIDSKRFYAYWETPSCRKCQKRKSYSQKDVESLFKKRGWILKDIYENSKTPISFVCERGHNQTITLSNFLRGVGCKQCVIENSRGENHYNWNPNKSKEDRISDRKYNEYLNWRKSAFKRDNYTCQICGDSKGGNLNAHHKDSYNWCKKRRLDITNAVTLCEKHHKLFHKLYGYGDNTEQQYLQFEKDFKTIN